MTTQRIVSRSHKLEQVSADEIVVGCWYLVRRIHGNGKQLCRAENFRGDYPILCDRQGVPVCTALATSFEIYELPEMGS